MLLPVVLAILDDPSAAVSVQGAWAMHHLATEALPAGEAGGWEVCCGSEICCWTPQYALS